MWKSGRGECEREEGPRKTQGKISVAGVPGTDFVRVWSYPSSPVPGIQRATITCPLKWVVLMGWEVDYNSFPCFSFTARENIFRKKTQTHVWTVTVHGRSQGPLSFSSQTTFTLLHSLSSLLSLHFLILPFLFFLPGSRWAISHLEALRCPLDGELPRNPSGLTCPCVLAQNVTQGPLRHGTEPGPSLCLPSSNVVGCREHHASRSPGLKGLEVLLWPHCHSSLLRVLPYAQPLWLL